MRSKDTVILYTDGACTGNPGPGGYAAILTYGRHRRELSGGFRHTTNNRMELTAAIVGLRTLKKPCQVILYSDSEYVVNAMSRGWAERWRANGWKRNKRDRALNPDLWEELLALCRHHEVEFRWVRGHSGNSDNERCDELAVGAAHGLHLPIDKGYEGTQDSDAAS